MPDGRLQRTRDNYLCEMCGYDSLIGSHTRTFDARGSMIERCPKRLYAVFLPKWQAPHLNDAERLTRRAAYLTDCDSGDETT